MLLAPGSGLAPSLSADRDVTDKQTGPEARGRCPRLCHRDVGQSGLELSPVTLHTSSLPSLGHRFFPKDPAATGPAHRLPASPSSAAPQPRPLGLEWLLVSRGLFPLPAAYKSVPHAATRPSFRT